MNTVIEREHHTLVASAESEEDGSRPARNGGIDGGSHVACQFLKMTMLNVDFEIGQCCMSFCLLFPMSLVSYKKRLCRVTLHSVAELGPKVCVYMSSQLVVYTKIECAHI